MTEDKKIDLNVLVVTWDSPLVSRDQATLDKFSGGLLNARTLANADSLGVGPKGKIVMGRKVAYTKESLVEWMESKIHNEGGGRSK